MWEDHNPWERYSSREERDKVVRAMRAENQECMKLFEEEMRKAKTAKRTIRKRMEDVDFFLNTFLLEHDGLYPMEQGSIEIREFMEEFFIPRCLGTTPEDIEPVCDSITQFYECMYKNGKLSQGYYDEMGVPADQIRRWKAACYAYNEMSLKAYHMILEADMPPEHSIINLIPEYDNEWMVEPEVRALTDRLSGKELEDYVCKAMGW